MAKRRRKRKLIPQLTKARKLEKACLLCFCLKIEFDDSAGSYSIMDLYCSNNKSN
ncbi:hypothetical protein FRACYDRAFT_271188 [Fragilariopsis cylindrus CCMP1102]|uniref:Uncharacterized protein n=1 Tax=Fragilariopsis cylindrus CCMP1102 TaxID=635003 RepID=A0A1E7EVS0_9STRA|nr:hypothetical protein FRACYDRAFT_271188 [Fragilariopsis cylindrus CCMP1102]|eukprot:OEU10061.1 hypothetical protein FRACYDRAFT_271188 [Fragilariopsis cylindrus CCMP1102]